MQKPKSLVTPSQCNPVCAAGGEQLRERTLLVPRVRGRLRPLHLPPGVRPVYAPPPRSPRPRPHRLHSPGRLPAQRHPAPPLHQQDWSDFQLDIWEILVLEKKLLGLLGVEIFAFFWGKLFFFKSVL